MFGKRNPTFPVKLTTTSRSPYRDQFALHRSSSRPKAVPADLFKPTHDIFNSKNREPNPTQYQSAKQLNYTDTSDHLKLSPRKKHSIPDHIEMDMMVSRSHSTPRFKSYREKVTDFQQTYPDFITRGRDTSMNNVGEFINDPAATTGVRRIDARSYSSCDTRKDLEKLAYRFFVEPSSPQNLSETNSPTRISKAFKAIYELNNEGRSCLMSGDADHHEKTRALFTSVIHDSAAAGGVGTIHKKFIIKNPTKRYYDHLKSYLMKRTASCASVSSEVSQQFEKADKIIESFLPLQNLQLRNTGSQKNNYVQEIIKKSQLPQQTTKEESPKTQKGAETTNASLNLGGSHTGSESRYVPWSKTPTNQSKLFQIKSIPLSASKSFSDCPQSPTVFTHTARSEQATQLAVTPRGRRTEATTPSVINTSRIQQGATPTKGSQAQVKSWNKIEPKTPVSSGGTPSRAKANNNPVRGSNHTGLYGQGVKVTPNLKRGYFSCKK